MKAGKELENYVQFVYQKLLDFMDEGAMVSSNVSVIGKSGVKHEFDVYYEFQHLNMRHVPYWKEGETDVPMVIIPKEKLKEEYIY